MRNSPIKGSILIVICAPYVSATIPYKNEPIGLVPIHIANNPIATPLSLGVLVNCKIDDWVDPKPAIPSPTKPTIIKLKVA